ncbi:NAD(P)/FAD-dependent oxidoreductase [Sungkyunkwania multivorans]|uniref:NAD(P)/FAD-dependent oxidoreductase n=1 Tax=Sungkyunkwania multivorans TaxID=1173618 RepID=A0ABW3D3U1_9FLAO
MKDYVVVGLGLAGIAFCEQLIKHRKEFLVYEDGSQSSSTVAGGMYNPVILKRFTAVWNAEEQLQQAMPFYKRLEKDLSEKLDHKVPIHRRFASLAEQNMWFEATDKAALAPFLSSKIVPNSHTTIAAENGFGEVLHTGRVDTKKLLMAYRSYLRDKGILKTDSFNHSKLRLQENGVFYGDIKARRIVFCEGYGLKRNPFFNYLPLNGTKGELLTIRAPQLKLDSVIKSSVFIIPIGDDLFRVGATYKWKDKTNTPTKEAREELLAKLKTFLKCDFEVVEQVAGVRPTVVDRRPLVGKHPKYDQLAVLNGMGSRGVMIAPTIAAQLFQHLENGKPLEKEVAITRFEEKYFVD